MRDDEDLPRQASFTAPDLAGWSEAELEAWIRRLQVEIERAQAEIGKKQALRNAAEALFKKR